MDERSLNDIGKFTEGLVLSVSVSVSVSLLFKR